MPATKRAPNPLRADPTRTATIRRRFGQLLAGKFARLRARVVRLVGEEDAFGLAPRRPFAFNQRWEFRTDAEKVKAFEDWLRTQIQQDITSTDAQALYRAYVEEGFRKGAGRAFDDTRRSQQALAAGQQRLDFYQGTRDEFLRSAFARPVATEKVKLLAGRVFTDLKGVTEQMATQMQRTLADGLVEGVGPRDLARRLAGRVDAIGRTRALTIARTETIRAHAEGQLYAFNELGVEELGVAAEWSTSGLPNVCELCAPLEGVVLKVAEARGMLPRHPNCACSWIPSGLGEDTKGQKRTKKAVEKAIGASVAQEGGEDKSRWVGADRTIDSSRPGGIQASSSPKGKPKPPSKTPAPAPIKAPTFTKGSEREAAAAYAQQTHGAWGKALTSEQKTAIQTYTEEEANAKINRDLRRGGIRREYLPTVQHLDQAIAAAPPLPHDLVVYRGMGHGMPIEVLKGQGEFTDQAYVSTSINREIADDFATGALVEIRVPAGTRMAAVDATGVGAWQGKHSENEYILGRGTAFRVTGEKMVEGKRVILAEVVPARR